MKKYCFYYLFGWGGNNSKTVRGQLSAGMCLVDGLSPSELRLIADKSESHWRDEKNRRIEFASPAFNLLNVLEQLGYRVVTSSAFVTGTKKFDTKDHVWTLHRPPQDYEL